jgi:hypothetical protein
VWVIERYHFNRRFNPDTSKVLLQSSNLNIDFHSGSHKVRIATEPKDDHVCIKQIFWQRLMLLSVPALKTPSTMFMKIILPFIFYKMSSYKLKHAVVYSSLCVFNSLTHSFWSYIICTVAYLFKARNVAPEKQPLLANDAETTFVCTQRLGKYGAAASDTHAAIEWWYYTTTPHTFSWCDA